MKSAACSGETKSHSAIIVLISFNVNPSFFPWMIKFSFSIASSILQLSRLAPVRLEIGHRNQIDAPLPALLRLHKVPYCTYKSERSYLQIRRSLER